jgi:EAL domain-containing protein (putative c-di-GMP-specific phosphodiesterase class I)
VSPTEFIHVAESNGMIVPIGEWALGEACRQLRLWHDAYPDVAPTMSVNLSGRQLQRSDLIEVVLGSLKASGVDPRYLVLEMTESILIDQTEETLANLHVLKNLGVELAIDDFGTGYSSLSYLHRLPVDIIKIDRSFVERLSPQVNEAGLAASIVRIGQGLGLTTVAEGIEQQHQLDVLKTMGCDRGQGFLFAEPLGPDDLARLLADPTRPLFRTGPLADTLA